MSKKSIAVIESHSLIDALSAVELMMSKSKVTLVGRYFLGERRVAAVIRGETREVEYGLAFVTRRMGKKLKCGIMHGLSRRAREVLLAPYEGFEPVVTIMEPESEDHVPEEGGRAVESKLDEVTMVESSEGPSACLVNIKGLTSKRKKRLGEILDHFRKMRRKKITSKQVHKALPGIPKATLGRDLDYLSSNDLIIKEGKGRGTHYLFKPLRSRAPNA